MRKQLVLIDNDNRGDWRLDDRTKDLGRKGVAAARAALQDAARRALEHADRYPAA